MPADGSEADAVAKGRRNDHWGMGMLRVNGRLGDARSEPIGAAVRSPPHPDSEVRRFTEEIGGRTAEVFNNRFRSNHFTGAQWSSPRVWIHGRASSSAAADVQITIFRTVRFTTP